MEFKNGTIIEVGDVVNGIEIIEILDEGLYLNDGSKVAVMLDNGASLGGWIAFDEEGNLIEHLDGDTYSEIERKISW